MDRTNHKSGLLKKEADILIPLINEPWRTFTLTELKQITNNTSHHYVYNALEKFSNEGTLVKKRVGNTNTYRCNEYANRIDSVILAAIRKKQHARHIPFRNIEHLAKNFTESFYAMLITGSYARKTHTKKSDIDIIIIVPNSTNKKAYDIILREGELMIPEVHAHVFTEQEYFDMLVNKEWNYGKESAINNIVVHGAEIYYTLVLRSIQHGFKGPHVHKTGTH